MMKHMKKAISFFMAICILVGNSYVNTKAESVVTMSDWKTVEEQPQLPEPVMPKGLFSYLKNNQARTASAAEESEVPKDFTGYVILNGKGGVFTTGDVITMDQKTMNIIVTRYQDGKDVGLPGNIEVDLVPDSENIIKITQRSEGELGKFYGTVEAKSPGYARVAAYITEKDENGAIVNTTPITCYIRVELKVHTDDYWKLIDEENVLVLDLSKITEYDVIFSNLTKEESAAAQVTWDSSNKDVVTVDKGKITPHSAGISTITITTTTKDHNEKSDTLSFDVIVSPVGLDPADGKYKQKVVWRTDASSFLLETNGYIAKDWNWKVYNYVYDGGELDDAVEIYNSDKSSKESELMRVEPSDLNGTVLFSGVKAGHYKVVGTVSDDYGEETWNQVVYDITVNLNFYGSPVIYMSIGDTYDIENNSNIPDGLFKEILSVPVKDGNSATLSEADGVVTALRKGTYTIELKYKKDSRNGLYPAEDPNCTGSSKKYTFYVTDELILRETEIHIATGVTYELDYLTNSTIDDSDIAEVIWTSSDEKYATVSNGAVTAKKSTEGSFVLITLTVVMTDGTAKNAYCKVFIEDSITKVTIEPDAVPLEIEETKWVNAIPDKNILGAKVEWRSSDENIFVITSTTPFSAQIKGVAGGTAELVAINADNVVVGFCTVTVVQEATSIEILVDGNPVKGQLIRKLSQGSVQLREDVKPENATNKKVYWESSNPKIAEVSSEGLVTFKKAGTVTIIVKTDDPKGSYAYCNIIIQDIMEEIELDETDIEMYTGETKRLYYQIDGVISEMGNPTLIWTSFDTSVVTVDDTGLLTAKGPGKTQVMVMSEENGSCYAICTVTVKQKATSVKMNYKELTMNRGEYFDMEVTITPVNSTEASLIWESLNPKVATVSSNGRITARAAGTAIIAVRTQSGVTSYCTVTVIEPVISLELDPTDLIVDVGEIFQIEPVFKPVEPTIKEVIWTSYDEKIATVNALGEVEGITRGSTIITCETVDGGFRAFCLVQVMDPAMEVTISPDNYRLGFGKTFTLEVTVTNHGEVVENLPIYWSSSDDSICSVDQSGRITGVDYGYATIRAEVDDEYGAYATCEVRVVREVTSIRLNHNALTIIQGQSASLKADIQPSNATYTDANFSSDDETVAVVDEDGTITAITPGTTWIWAKAKDNSGKYARCWVTVIEPIPATGVTVSDKQIVLIAGESKKLVYTVKPYNTTDSVTWSSGEETIATVDGEGKVTAHRTGTTMVTAMTNSGKTAQVEVIVVGLSRSSVEMSLYDDRVTLYVDGAVNGVRWDSDNSSIVEVRNGKLTSRKVGTTYVTATVNGRKLRCKVTVVANKKK